MCADDAWQTIRWSALDRVGCFRLTEAQLKPKPLIPPPDSRKAHEPKTRPQKVTQLLTAAVENHILHPRTSSARSKTVYLTQGTTVLYDTILCYRLYSIVWHSIAW